MRHFNFRHLWYYNKELEYFTFQLFTIDCDDEGVTLIIFNFSLYYGK